MTNFHDQRSFFSLFGLFDLVKNAPLKTFGNHNNDNTQIERTTSNFYPRENFDRHLKACRASRPDFEKPLGRVTGELELDGDNTHKVGS